MTIFGQPSPFYQDLRAGLSGIAPGGMLLWVWGYHAVPEHRVQRSRAQPAGPPPITVVRELPLTTRCPPLGGCSTELWYGEP